LYSVPAFLFGNEYCLYNHLYEHKAMLKAKIIGGKTLMELKCLKTIQITILFLILPLVAYATPSITSVTGAVSQGSTITVNGAGFNTKSKAAPLAWDNCSGTDITVLWSGGWPNKGTTNYQLAYRTPIRTVSLPHTHITKYLAGSHGDATDYNDGYNVMFWKTLTNVTYPTTIYASWYHQVDPNWDVSTDGSDNNFKLFDFSNGSSPFTMNGSTDSNWYLDYAQTSQGADPGQTRIPWENPSWEMNDDGGNLPEVWYGNGPSPLGHWVKREVEVKITTDSTGYVKEWDNGSLIVNRTGIRTDFFSGTTKSIGIGGYARKEDSNSWQYFADMYFDTTPQRILICYGSSWATRGICEVQIPQTWTDNGTSAQIAATVNQGSFPDNSTAYLYVVDANGNSSSGTKITFGSSGSAGPQPPTGLTAKVQ
jgi:hypothetical protein